MTNRFQTRVNKMMVDDSGTEYVQVKHDDDLYRVDLMTTEEELKAVKAFDNRFYVGPQAINLEELAQISEFGRVMAYRDPKSREIRATAQILLNSVRWQEVRMGDAFSYGLVGRGYGQIVLKAQEVIARSAGKERIRMTVRLDNTITIRACMKAGFRATEYDPTRFGARKRGGARLVLTKDLIHEQHPFAPKILSSLVRDNKTRIVKDPEQMKTVLQEKPDKIGIYVFDEDRVDLNSHKLVQMAIYNDYFGIGLLVPAEIGDPEGPRKLLVFQRQGLPPHINRLSMPVHVSNEFNPLREVIISHTPENAQIRAEFAINDVAKLNIDNIDPIAFKDEYNLFVGTLLDHDVSVVHTNSLGKEGKSAIFTRDPAFVLGNIFVIGQLGQQQRVYETEGMRQISSEVTALDLTNEENAVVEGGDVIIIGKNTIAVGLGQRTNTAGLEKLRQEFPEYEFIGVPHTDLHLDVLFTMLGPKKCLADFTRLPAEFIQRLKNDDYFIVEADPGEQVSLGCNVVALGPNKVIAVKENQATNQRLKDAGVEVVEVSMPNVVKWGGGPRCITCPTNREGN